MGQTVEAVTIDRCGGSTLRSFIIGKPSQFHHLKSISLESVPITGLNVEDLIDFPKLRTLLLFNVPITHMENGLLCYTDITITIIVNSFGYLGTFPYQIFQCTIPLKLEYFELGDHNIASLPAHAFGNATQLRVLELLNIGLEIIHKDAFSGLWDLEFTDFSSNKLLEISSVIMPSRSASLRVLEYTNNELNRTLNLTAISIAYASSLQVFRWESSYVSNVNGRLCSQWLNSELEIVGLENNMIEAIPNDIFHHCMSLKLLSLANNQLACLPKGLLPQTFPS